MMLYAIKYTIEYGPGTLLRSLTPGILFGAGPPDYQSFEEQGLAGQGTSIVGDEEAKQVTPLGSASLIYTLYCKNCVMLIYTLYSQMHDWH